MYTYWLNIILFKYLVKHIFYYDVKKSEVRQELANGKVNVTLCRNCYLVDPASSHTLVLKIKPCMSKCFVIITLDCRRLIITVIVLLRLFYRWIPVEILELIHVTHNISLWYIGLLFFSNQSVSTLWVIHNNAWRSLYKWQFIQVSDLSVSQ